MSILGEGTGIFKDVANSYKGGNVLTELIRSGLLTARSMQLDKQMNAFSGSATPTNSETGEPANQDGITAAVDWRARLRPKDGGRSLFWFGQTATGDADGDNESAESGPPQVDYLLRPLYQSGGLVWQYTPDILLSATANYNMSDFHGQNYPLVTYRNSTPPAIPVTADFTANTVTEARYLLGVLHFLKVATKSFFGDTAVEKGLYGTPPPVMLFEYLGDHGFNKVPVVVTSYAVNYTSDVDYVPVKTGVNGEGETTYVPTVVNIAVTLQPSYTPHKLRKRFDLNAFTTGQSYKDGFI